MKNMMITFIEKLRGWLDDNKMQDSNTNQLIFDVTVSNFLNRYLFTKIILEKMIILSNFKCISGCYRMDQSVRNPRGGRRYHHWDSWRCRSGLKIFGHDISIKINSVKSCSFPLMAH